VLVAAVLAPQRAEHAGLGHVRLAAQPLDDQVVLLGREAELGGSVAQRGPGDGSAHAAAASTASRREPSTYRPSSSPRSGSTARSGCGIIPMTFPASFTMPAIDRAEPFTFASGVTSPEGSQ